MSFLNVHKTIPVAVILFKRDDRILFLRRISKNTSNNTISPLSGHVDAGETFTQAAVREAAEEIGVRIDPQDLKPFHLMHRRLKDGREGVDMYFITEKWEGEPNNCEPERCSELQWIAKDNLPSDTLNFARQAVEKGFAGEFYSEWWE